MARVRTTNTSESLVGPSARVYAGSMRPRTGRDR